MAGKSLAERQNVNTVFVLFTIRTQLYSALLQLVWFRIQFPHTVSEVYRDYMLNSLLSTILHISKKDFVKVYLISPVTSLLSNSASSSFSQPPSLFLFLSLSIAPPLLPSASLCVTSIILSCLLSPPVWQWAAGDDVSTCISIRSGID